MSVFIIDASVAAKWFVPEHESEAALSLLNEKNRLHAPDFMLLEMDNVLCTWTRRGVIPVEEAANVRDTLRRYPIQNHPFTSYLDSAFAIANQTGQSIYDRLYIALAALLHARMVTADRRLYEGIRNGRFKKHMIWIQDIEEQ